MTRATETKIAKEMLAGIDEAYHDILRPVLRKHAATLDKLDKLMQSGAAGRARQLWLRSGLLDDLAKAIAGAGAVSSHVIRDGLERIREAVRHDTGRA